MNLSEMFRNGGPFMNFISLMALIAVGVTVWKIVQMATKKEYNFKLLDLVLMAGALAAASGILSQIVGIVEALKAIREAADISPQIVMEGAMVSFYAPIWGFVVLIFSLIFHYVLKEIVKGKSI
ncbi:MotA/TolQ/ExbB proton channel family protein [Maribellus maritimus]|uniref:MotA/TolQ/ExbB proton channel family protein n=1 Tax=Maribellus maritimus TaxID=2870838 RepID=UPI001EEB6287|nr:MotA/TolQ/ExbB proton channel family protein [Maribellus maritimus]MCG6187985.1 MotA/TolQ/ExbB proton channel family protein [Maribellus maritimus]